MNLLSVFNKIQQQDGVEYHVRADGYKGGEFDLTFALKKDAVEYVNSLKKSKRQLKATITRREYEGGYIASEKVVK